MHEYQPDLIITPENRNDVIRYLINQGHPGAALHVARTVDLANLYHDRPAISDPTDLQKIAADIFAKCMVLMQPRLIAPADEELVRSIARSELERLPSRKLEVTTPRGVVTLEGLQHYRTEIVLRIAALNHAILLVGPAGCGKTTIAEHAAKALQLPFYITSTINDTHELIGFVDGHGKYHDTPFRNAFEHGGVWTADEIDAWDAAALLAANSALANGYANFPDRSAPIYRHIDFRMVATANTFGTGADRIYVGRNELDAASLDRFATIEVDYDVNLERMFAGAQDEWLDHVWKVRKRVSDKKIRHVVSSRAIAMGAAALTAGLTWDDVNEIYLFKGMSAKDREKVE